MSFGYEGLRIMLEQQGMEPISDVRRWRSLPPSQTVVVAMGRAGDLEAIVGSLSEYARAGGAVLAASDYAGAELGLVIGHGPVTVVDERLAYRRYADCPLVAKMREGHPLFQNVTRLATNRPGYFRWEGGTRSFLPLAWFPLQCRVPEGPLGEKPLLASQTFGDQGRIVLAADHSLFTNQMLLAEDNLLFAWNCVSWLCDSGERNYLLFMEDGRPVGAVDVGSLLSRAQPAMESSMPAAAAGLPPEAAAELPPASLVVFANSLIAGLEDEDVFNVLAERQPRGMRARVFRRGVLLSATCVLLGVGAFMLLLSKGGRAGPTAQPPFAERPAADTRLAPVEVGGMLASQFFREAGARLVVDAVSTALAPPRVTTDEGLLQQWRIERNVKRLWRMATRRERRRMSRRQLEQVAAQICALRQLQCEGRLRLSFAPPR